MDYQSKFFIKNKNKLSKINQSFDENFMQSESFFLLKFTRDLPGNKIRCIDMEYMLAVGLPNIKYWKYVRKYKQINSN